VREKERERRKFRVEKLQEKISARKMIFESIRLMKGTLTVEACLDFASGFGKSRRTLRENPSSIRARFSERNS